MNRRIMVEVTPQELEKIQAGKLNADDMTIEELINILIYKMGKPVDCKFTFNTFDDSLTAVKTYTYKHDEHNSITLITSTMATEKD